MTISATGRHQRRLLVVFGLTAFYLLAEVAGGLLTGSLALLADAGHMLTDVAGLGLALLAIRFATKPASPTHTYGFYRAEILAALANALVLIFISAYVLYEAYQRLLSPPAVATGGMLIVATVGLAVNWAGIRILRSAEQESLNMRGAYFEVLSDLLTSIGVIVAGLIMLMTGWYYADPIISAGIGLFILPRTWTLLKGAVAVLLEGTPADISLAAVRETILTVTGVSSVHDLHVWSLTSGVNALSAHVVVGQDAVYADVLSAARDRVVSYHKIAHVTLQIEPVGWEQMETHL